ITELNFALSLAKYDKSGSFGIQTINGYLFNPNFSLGLGVGLDIYNYKAFMPIFIDARYYFFQEKVTPYAAIGAGCALNIDNSYRPDIFINPSIGIRFQLLKKNAFNVGMGYRYQGSLYNPSYFNLKLGVSFW
ncbi:MAG: hypothetical protein ABI388_09560, partial [Bacteroidia bacterium]